MTEPKKPVVSPAKDGVNSANLSARLFGERLKALRKKMELKQTVFAESIGTSEDTISEIERGLLSPRLDMLCKIAEQFGMTVSQLLDFQDEPKTKPAVNQALTALILYLKTKTPREIKAAIEASKYFLDKAQAIYKKPRRRPYGIPVGRKPFVMRDK
jgi:transcriptional regulator with XRE-family HTH domain